MTAVAGEPRADGHFVLEARDVSVRFGGTVALNRVSIGLRAGTILGLVGPNGAGKTTLFDLLTGITRGSGGTVHFGGEEISNRSVTWRARHGLKRTFQRQQVFGWLTVEENLLCALEWHGGGGGLVADVLRLPGRRGYQRERMARVERVLELCGLADLRSSPAAGLPIGTARLVELGRAIVDEPRVLLLDEPTSGLEDPEVERLGSVVSQLSRESMCSIGLVEHNMSFVMAMCEEIVVLNLGQVLAIGSPVAIQQNPVVAEAYLGT